MFLHGLGADRRQTLSALASLEGIRLIAPDMPGHGDSMIDDYDSLSFDDSAEAVLSLIDDLGIDQFDLGGLSMGSGISLNIVKRVPERVRRLVLLRPSWLDQTCPEHLSIVARVGKWIESEGLESASELLQKDAEYLQIESTVPKAAQALMALFTRPQALEAARVLSALWEDRPFAQLSEIGAISHPALVLHCSQDSLHPRRVAEAIAAVLPEVVLDELPARYVDGESYQKDLLKKITRFLQPS